MTTFIDGLTAAFLIGGAAMSVAAAIGLLRFPDLMSRMHAATKPQVLGLLLMLAALGLTWQWRSRIAMRDCHCGALRMERRSDLFGVLVKACNGLLRCASGNRLDHGCHDG